jgi:uncharacterized membrane protein
MLSVLIAALLLALALCVHPGYAAVAGVWLAMGLMLTAAAAGIWLFVSPRPPPLALNIVILAGLLTAVTVICMVVAVIVAEGARS